MPKVFLLHKSSPFLEKYVYFYYYYYFNIQISVSGEELPAYGDQGEFRVFNGAEIRTRLKATSRKCVVVYIVTSQLGNFLKGCLDVWILL